MNVGLYNGFVAAGLFWGVSAGIGDFQVRVFFLACVIIPGIFRLRNPSQYNIAHTDDTLIADPSRADRPNPRLGSTFQGLTCEGSASRRSRPFLSGHSSPGGRGRRTGPQGAGSTRVGGGTRRVGCLPAGGGVHAGSFELRIEVLEFGREHHASVAMMLVDDRGSCRHGRGLQSRWNRPEGTDSSRTRERDQEPRTRLGNRGSMSATCPTFGRSPSPRRTSRH